MTKTYLAFLFLVFATIALFAGSAVFASNIDGTVSGYAWSQKVGWINFGVLTGNIHVTDSLLSGYAWSDNSGWINLAPTKSGVKNDAEGNLSGSAWGWNLGYIDFASVKINSSGNFTGTAYGENTGTINFSCDNCNVATDWRPASSRTTPVVPTAPNLGSGGPGQGPPSPIYSVLINNLDNYTNKKAVLLALKSGDGTEQMEISNYSDFRDTIKESYNTTKKWNLIEGDGQKTVFVKFITKYDIASPIVFANIILDTASPEIKITSIKENYNQDEEIIIAGITEPNLQVDIFLDEKYGSFAADQNGEWFVTFGKMNIGAHKVELFAKDFAGNLSKSVKSNFNVNQILEPIILPKQPDFWQPILDKIQQGLKPLIPNFFPDTQKPVAKTPILDKIGQGLYSIIPFLPKSQTPEVVVKLPKPVVMISKIPPLSLSGSWNIFPMKAVKNFVLAPLPKDVAMLAKKFPELNKTFKDVGVAKITDMQKIQNSKLSLPNLTETLGLSKIEITPGKFIPAKGIPVANLTPTTKERIPSEIIFAKTGGGLVDYNIALSLNSAGQAEQKIKTLTGSPLQLVFKADGKVKRVRGYIIFKSKKTQPVSIKVPLESLALSSLFSAPNFAAALSPTTNIPIEGAKLDIQTPTGLERRLVISTFDYQDTGNGVYTANVQAPVVDGEYEVITVVDYEQDGLATPVSREVKLITVVDPEGYVYEKSGDKETRIVGAVVSLYWLNPKTKQYESWNAGDFQQENPQVTNVSGSYSFLVPEGDYYLKVDAPGYLSYDGKPFEVKEGSGVHINIELKTKYWFLDIVDWKTMLLVVVVLMLVYNFYRDRKRDKLLLK